MSNFDKYSAAISEFFDNCSPTGLDDLLEVIYTLEIGLISSVGAANSSSGIEEKDLIVNEYFARALRNVVWLGLPIAETSAILSLDDAVTSVCALSAAKAHLLDENDGSTELHHTNEFIQSIQRCCVAAVLSAVSIPYGGQIDEEVMDAMRSEYLEALSSVNKGFIDRWSEFLASKYGVKFKTRNI